MKTYEVSVVVVVPEIKNEKEAIECFWNVLDERKKWDFHIHPRVKELND